MKLTLVCIDNLAARKWYSSITTPGLPASRASALNHYVRSGFLAGSHSEGWREPSKTR